MIDASAASKMTRKSSSKRDKQHVSNFNPKDVEEQSPNPLKFNRSNMNFHLSRDKQDSAKFRQDVIYIHEFSKSKFLETEDDQIEKFQQGMPITLTGEKGYRTAIASHGLSGKHHKSVYFEVEIIPPKTPLPFINVKSAIRVGLCNVDVQDTEKPLGSNRISYCYSSTGKLVNNEQGKMTN